MTNSPVIVQRPAAPANSVLLDVSGLCITYPSATEASVDSVSFALDAGRTLGIVGESGSGKSTLCLALLGLLPTGTTVTGQALFGDRDLIGLPPRELRKIRGKEIGLVYQDPMAALNPVKSIGAQLREPLVLHTGLGRAAADKEAVRLLDRVGIADAQGKLSMYPFELSGGMRQRVAIAMAISCEPALIIADEPTTALDVTVQAQVLALLAELQTDLSLTMLFVSHDLSVVASVSDQILVMQNGVAVEQGTVHEVLNSPADPYTRQLIESLLTLEKPRKDRER
ncbi:MAG: oligopeptide/dipeptide transporter, ATPase subunit [Subtercola sp.]|nr:oligopeptide/dipeptide transporter, ATPase subunit [Subtercola sp.]